MGRFGALFGQYSRWMYRSGRPNRVARPQNRLSGILFAAGLLPHRAARLEVSGRRSGRTISFPVVIADWEGREYLVSMLGERANWVKNVRAADGVAVLRRGRREPVILQEVEVADRAPIIRRYAAVAPGGRPHLKLDRDAPLEDCEALAPSTPVFQITSRRNGQHEHPDTDPLPDTTGGETSFQHRLHRSVHQPVDIRHPSQNRGT